MANAISIYYPGTFRGLRKDMGEADVDLKKLPGYWNEDTIFKKGTEFLEIEDYEVLPLGRVMRDLGYGGLVQATTRHYSGGIRRLRNDLKNFVRFGIRGLTVRKVGGAISGEVRTDTFLALIADRERLWYFFWRLVSAICNK